MELLDFINSSLRIKPETALSILKYLQREELPKNYSLHQAGKTCNRVYFIQKGLARMYYFKDEKDVTCWFANENNLLTAIDSFFSQKPSRYNIELLEDSILLSVSYNDLENLFDEYPEVERLARLFAYNTILQLADRIDAIQFSSANERYHLLAQKYPEVLRRAPLGYIASYLGITQETLSRIRGRY